MTLSIVWANITWKLWCWRQETEEQAMQPPSALPTGEFKEQDGENNSFKGIQPFISVDWDV